MATDHFAAAFALPQFLLFFEKLFHSMFLDELQIVYQAHSEVSSVSFINCFQSAAWKALALEAESDFTFGQLGTLLLQEGTVLSSQSAADATGHPDSFCPQIVLQS
jgi:hypothetical protein